MSPEEARDLLRGTDTIASQAFEILQSIAALDARGGREGLSQELLLRALERAEEFNGTIPVLRQLAREHGLFPYLDQASLGFPEQVAYEFHKPGELGTRGIVFHAPQARVYDAIMAGESVILSAPTSFGKSLIIDAILLNERFANVLIVVPTIALIDETRRRLAELGSSHKIITHAAQQQGDRNVFVLTQERAVGIVDELDVDFFVIDEFYKLAPRRNDGDDQRAAILNHVFYRLARRGVQFYMLGPSVRAIAPGLTERFECRFIYEPYHTVVSELHRVDPAGDAVGALVELCARLEGPTMVYCRSPTRAAELAEHLAASREAQASDELMEAVAWIGEQYHEKWHLTTALRKRIGVHHGRIPRAMAQYVVRAFERGGIDLLVCTSTLIEGVNTSARNIIVFDNTISTSRFDFFTFNNIRGRSGRMFRHFVGHVYLFHEPPADELPFIDVPSVTLSDDASDGLLLQLEEDDLDDHARRRTLPYREQELLSMGTLRANSGLEPDLQLTMAQTLLDEGAAGARLAAGWKGFPEWEELVAACQLIWSSAGGVRLGAGSVRSAQQLAFRINDLRHRPSIRSLIDAELAFRRNRDLGVAPDEAVQNVLDFLRLWAGFHFPRLLTALDRIQREILPRLGISPGELSPYAAEVEHYFLGAHVLALEEYGLPLQIARELPFPRLDGGLDEYLDVVRGWDAGQLGLGPFPRRLFVEVQMSL